MSSNDRTRRVKNPAQRETELYAPPGNSRTERLPAAKAKKSGMGLLPWILGGGAMLAVLLCGGLGVGVTVWLKQKVDTGVQNIQEGIGGTDSREDVSELPQIEVDPALTKVRFVGWERKRVDGLDTLVVTVAAVGERVHPAHLKTFQYDRNGLKLKDRMLLFPELKAGESGKGSVLLGNNAVRVRIEPR